MEAMSCGLTVVASDVGGIPEIVDNTVNGFLFRAGDHLGLAGILLQILEDENLRKRLGREARRTAVESFDGRLMCSRTVSVYESLLDNR
jgi:glycosyltransferase involved in cell wall biosynthesis